MIPYAGLPPSKKAFVFELDNVLYPEKDYLLQVYYLFAAFIEYTESVPPAADLVEFFKKSYTHHGAEGIFDRAQEVFAIDEKYRENFLRLHQTACLPLKLLLFEPMHKLLQDMVADNKQIFLLTNGNPLQQLNKIKQMEWNGLEKHLTVYFSEEWKPKPETDALQYLLERHRLKPEDLLIFGNSKTDEIFAHSGGVGYIPVNGLS